MALLRPDSTIIKPLLCTWHGADPLRQNWEVSPISQLWGRSERSRGGQGGSLTGPEPALLTSAFL